MGLLFEMVFLTKNNVKSGDKTHQRGRKMQKTVECGKRGNGKFSICSKSPQKAATNWLYTKGAVGEETKPPHKVDHSLLNRVPQNPDRPTGLNRPPAAPTSYCSPAHARQSPGGGQTTYSLPLRRGVPDTGQHRHFSFFTVLSLFFADGGPAWTAAAHGPDTGKTLCQNAKSARPSPCGKAGAFCMGGNQIT